MGQYLLFYYNLTHALAITPPFLINIRLIDYLRLVHHYSRYDSCALHAFHFHAVHLIF